MVDQFRLPRRQRWRQLILPGIFPVLRDRRDHRRRRRLERVDRGRDRHLRQDITLVASGLGAYIAQAAHNGDVRRGPHRRRRDELLRRRASTGCCGDRLYHLAETRYSLVT